MAEAIARDDAGDVIEPSSAGLHPLGEIAHLTRQTLERNGYTATGLTSEPLTPEAVEAADILINMTGILRKTNFDNLEKVEDWMVEDPFGGTPEEYQRVFEGIQRRVKSLAANLRERQREVKTER